MHLSECFIELFTFVADFQRKLPLRHPSLEEVRAAVERLLERSQLLATSAQIDTADYEHARFAVCAYVDEALAGGQWQHRHLWLKDQLQKRYFHTSDAGEEFFQRLAGLGLHKRDVREVFYLCLVLGFTGKFCKPGDEYQLEQLKAGNLKLLLGTSVGLPPLDRGELFPEAYPSAGNSGPTTQKRRRTFSLLAAACTAGPLLVFAVLYAVYSFTLSNVTDNLLRAVSLR